MTWIQLEVEPLVASLTFSKNLAAHRATQTISALTGTFLLSNASRGRQHLFVHEVCPQLHDFLNGDEFLDYLETTEI